MKNEFYLCNVVWYDGVDAYVSKFILQGSNYSIDADAVKKVIKYLEGNGEMLKIDINYQVTFDNIVALGQHGNAEEKCAYDRFKEMYF